MHFFEDIKVGQRREIGSFTFTADGIKAFAAKFDPQLSRVYVRHIRFQDYYPARAPISASTPRIRASVPTPKEMRA